MLYAIHTDAPAVVVHPPAVINIDESDTLQVVCVGYGIPVPAIRWSISGCSDISLLTGVKIYSDVVTVNNVSFQRSLLQLCDINQLGAMNYTCSAENGIVGTGIASISANFLLNVQPKSSDDSVTMSPSSNATLMNNPLIDDEQSIIIITVEAFLIVVLFVSLLIVLLVGCLCYWNLKKVVEKHNKLLSSFEQDKPK